eukprot:937195-Rhodomonas_salina.2
MVQCGLTRGDALVKTKPFVPPNAATCPPVAKGHLTCWSRGVVTCWGHGLAKSRGWQSRGGHGPGS